ncbi:hypothetical protein BH11GEM1_BH11GEM1_05910 [soil metagenome]
MARRSAVSTSAQVIQMMRPTRLTLFVAVCALVLAGAPSAQAQFGGLMNRAKDKLADKAKENLGPIAVGEQLTEDLLGKVVTGAQAADRVLANRDKAVAVRDAKNKELSVLIDKNAPVHQAFDQANSKIMDCRDASLTSLQQSRSERVEVRMKAMESDPAFHGKVQLIAMKYGKAIKDAQERQDALALSKLQTEMTTEMLGGEPFMDTKKDSVATDAKCGKAPKLPVALAQEEQLRKDVAAADDEIRTLEARAVNQGASASGLEQVRYLQLKERALSIMKRMDGEGAGVRYGDDEMAAVKKRMSDLEKVKRAL